MPDNRPADAATQGRPKPRAVFTEGSILRHVLVMTSTSTIGLMAIFVVDLLSLLYVSWLGDAKITAGVGYSTQVLFFITSLNIGLLIGVTAVVSRAIGAGDRPRAQRLSASGLVIASVTALLVSVLILPWRREIVALLGARDETLEVAVHFLEITLPANAMMAFGMVLSGILRAAGDARRAMYVTLAGGIVTAVLDPILIFGLGFGVYGAAISTVASRLAFCVVGLWGCVRVHGLIGRPQYHSIILDLRPVLGIALPAIATNIAAPVAIMYSVRVFSAFGEPTVAAFAIMDRVTPVCFGVLFALTGAVGPIIGQNYGAKKFDRITSVLNNCFGLSTVYVLVMWAILWVAAPYVPGIFGTHGETAELVQFFSRWGSGIWLFLGWLFVANASFNNLGFPLISTAFNWGRATLGTIPFVTWGAAHYGAEGGFLGIIAGAMVFGIAGVATAYAVTLRLAKKAGAG